MNDARAQSCRAGEHGGILGALLWLLLIGGLIYVAASYLPAYAQYYEVKRIVSEAANNALTEPSDVRLRSTIVERCANLGTHAELRDGQPSEVPDVDLGDDDVAIDRDDEPPSIRIQVVYTKMVHFPFTQALHPWQRTVIVKQDLKPVRW